MRIALLGFGKMGRAVYDLLPYKGITCSHVVTSTSEPHRNVTLHHSVKSLPFQEIDLVIDFSTPYELLNRVETISFHKKPLVIGTTGWESQREKIFEAVARNKSALLWAPNFSIGISLHAKVCAFAAQLFSAFPEFDVGLFERHHKNKADHPSGTAHLLAGILLSELTTKDSHISNLPPGAVLPNQLHVAYQRVGSSPGYHEVLFENATDTVTISHRAASRTAFAQGSLESALWIKDKKGVFTFNDMLNDRITGPMDEG